MNRRHGTPVSCPWIRPWLERAGLFLFGCILALTLAEILLRSTGLGTPSPMVRYGDLPFKRRPFHEFVNTRERRNVVTLNNWGFHDRNRSVRSNGYRYVALGDSFVEGNQMAVDKLFTTLIEASLKQLEPGLEVVNAGAGGAGTAYEYLLYKEFFLGKIDHDHLILFISNGNDLPNNHPELELKVNGNDIEGKVYLTSQGDVYVKNHRASLIQRIVEFTDRHLASSYTVHNALYSLKQHTLRKRYLREQETEPQAARGDGRTPQDAAWGDSLRGTLRLIERWGRELEARGVAFSVVVLPHADHYFSGNYGNAYKAELVDRLEELGRRREFRVLRTELGGHHPSEIFFLIDGAHGHYNGRGHELVAAQVTEFLRRAD